ncbi:hypothetical protein B0H14DRAFT_3165519 [Mycena olivaceomarginata]|nr:hypothetical protein B0H14DRAFT_3165519 [Mycena olivaceomarginata]
MIHIHILVVNTDKEIWGEDAREFKSSNQPNDPSAERTSQTQQPRPRRMGQSTHLRWDDQRIGLRFSRVELKAVLFTLIRVFEFEAAVPKGGIRHASTRLVALGAPALHGSYRLALCGIPVRFGVGSGDRGLHNLNARIFFCFFSESHIDLATVLAGPVRFRGGS